MNNIKRVISYIDGFNLYHAIHDLRKNHLKWVNLRCLSQRYINKPNQKLDAIKYFSAYATWKPGPYSRHRAYVKALNSQNIRFIQGRFKEKIRFCKRCKKTYVAHEEKETDVNIALHLLNDAYQNAFDHALIISADSDLTPAIRLIKRLFPKKLIFIAHPPKLNLPKELIYAAGGYHFCKEIRESHIANCLLPDKIFARNKDLIATRPSEYDPPNQQLSLG